VTELEPGVRFGCRPVSGPLRTHNVYTFGAEPGGTLVTLPEEIELRGSFRFFEPLLARMVRRQYEANLGRLNSTMEAQPAKGA
jgi:hypothetical protein